MYREKIRFPGRQHTNLCPKFLKRAIFLRIMPNTTRNLDQIIVCYASPNHKLHTIKTSMYFVTLLEYLLRWRSMQFVRIFQYIVNLSTYNFRLTNCRWKRAVILRYEFQYQVQIQFGWLIFLLSNSGFAFAGKITASFPNDSRCFYKR